MRRERLKGYWRGRPTELGDQHFGFRRNSSPGSYPGFVREGALPPPGPSPATRGWVASPVIFPELLRSGSTGGGCPRGGGGAAAEPPRASHQYAYYWKNWREKMNEIKREWGGGGEPAGVFQISSYSGCSPCILRRCPSWMIREATVPGSSPRIRIMASFPTPPRS